MEFDRFNLLQVLYVSTDINNVNTDCSADRCAPLENQRIVGETLRDTLIRSLFRRATFMGTPRSSWCHVLNSSPNQLCNFQFGWCWTVILTTSRKGCQNPVQIYELSTNTIHLVRWNSIDSERLLDTSLSIEFIRWNFPPTNPIDRELHVRFIYKFKPTKII